MIDARNRPGAAIAYALAALTGLVALFLLMPAGTITGRGGLWVHPAADVAVTLAGHLAFQAPGWHWPLLRAPALAWPIGRSIALTDSNPLLSLAAKLLASLRGHPTNLFGLWLALCWCLQPVAALYALRGVGMRRAGTRPEAMAAVVLLSLLCPAWLMRFMHVNLLGHFLLLTALGLAARMIGDRAAHPWWQAGLLLAVAVFVHPYLYVFAAAVLSAPALASALRDPRAAWRPALAYAAAVAAPAAAFWLASGGFGGDRGGYGYYSMNLLSPVWPQLSGLFGADLPILDANGGQYEGFNYLGAGVLLLIGAAIVVMVGRLFGGRRPGPRTVRGVIALVVPLAALTALAVTPNLFIGHLHLQVLPVGPVYRAFEAIQSSGRAFWPVGYALMVGAVALLAASLPRLPLAVLLAIAVGLQIIDTAPERAQASGFFTAAGQPAPLFEMPAGATLLRIVPPCDQNFSSVDLLRLTAIRAGLLLGDMRMARQPAGYDCQSALSDGLDTALAPGEMRFFLPAALPDLHPGTLGAAAICKRIDPGILCRRDR